MSTPHRLQLGHQDLDAVMEKYRDRPGEILSILEQAQGLNHYKYLPLESLQYIAKKTRIPLARIYSIATFFAFFNLKPQGEHTVTFCQGTACHTRGSLDLYEYIKLYLGIQNADGAAEDNQPITTPDNKFTVRTVACFGQCALAPVVSVDNVIHGHMTKDKLQKIIQKIQEQK